MVRWDFNNMFEHALGRGKGLKPSDIDQLRKRGREIHSAIQEMRRARTTPFYRVISEESELAPIVAAGEEIRGRWENFVVLGVGGSALGAKSLHLALNHPLHNWLPRQERRGARLFVADNIDPETFASLLEYLEPSKTLFNVVSRSGETAETLAQFLIARDHMERALGPGRSKEHFLLTTDAQAGPLRRVAEREGYASMGIAGDLVGRYSVFSAVGLLPAAASGIDVRSLVAGARAMADRCDSPELWENPAYMSGALHYLAQRKKGKRICVIMPYSDLLTGIAEWFCQLWAESLGKGGELRGKNAPGIQCPVRALGITDQHSQLQLYMEGPDDKAVDFIRVERFSRAAVIPRLYEGGDAVEYLGGHELSELFLAEERATEMALAKNGRMNSTVVLDSITPEAIGQLLFLFEIQTVFAAGLYRVNPFDQPGVEKGKRLTYGMMGRPGYRREKEEVLALQRKKRKRFVL